MRLAINGTDMTGSSIALKRTTMSTPLGSMLALSSERGLCALEFLDPADRLHRLEARLTRWFRPHTVEDGASPIFDLVRGWLEQYFGSPIAPAIDIPLDLRGHEFERRVWSALLQVPCGSTMTYGQIAAGLGRPLAARAAGAAVGSNPIGIIVPCHRIIGSTGSLTGYGGGLERKRWLLQHEARVRLAQGALPL